MVPGVKRAKSVVGLKANWNIRDFIFVEHPPDALEDVSGMTTKKMFGIRNQEVKP